MLVIRYLAFLISYLTFERAQWSRGGGREPHALYHQRRKGVCHIAGDLRYLQGGLWNLLGSRDVLNYTVLRCCSHAVRVLHILIHCGTKQRLRGSLERSEELTFQRLSPTEMNVSNPLMGDGKGI